MRLRHLPLLLALTPAAALAQQSETSASCLPRGDFNRAACYQPVEILADGRVTVRLCAPEASDVRVLRNDRDGPSPTVFVPGPVRGL